MSDQHDVVLVMRDRPGAGIDQIVTALDTTHLAAVLQPVLAADAVLCTDGSPALAAAVHHIDAEHHVINLSAGQRVIGPWHNNNVNGYHSWLKNWLRRFKGMASPYLHHYLGCFGVLERFKPVHLAPQALLALAIGIWRASSLDADRA
jgi:ISXO2-like transposase domain